jgi:hypothetical protein
MMKYEPLSAGRVFYAAAAKFADMTTDPSSRPFAELENVNSIFSDLAMVRY